MLAKYDLPELTRRVILAAAAALLVASLAIAQTDPLPSWNNTAPKAAIVAFVEKVTKEGSPEFVPEQERIAVFDNDGTLWAEHPMYTQLAFALDRVKVLAPAHPEWKDMQPFKAVLEGDMKTLAASGEKGLVDLIMTTHAGMTSDDFKKVVTDWLSGARDPKFKRPYTELVYQPMIELLAYLRANGFKTFIVSGGGVEFMRPWAEQVYGVPPEQVIGSSIKTEFRMRDDTPTLYRLSQVNFIDDKAGKPVGINAHIGRRPIAAFGNSDGDLEMLQWTTMGGAPARFGMIIHHTDAHREYAYDRDTEFGRLDKALDAAAIAGWTVVDMKADWKQIFREK
ncbi:HAD family hydrolase [Rhizobium mongolense]